MVLSSRTRRTPHCSPCGNSFVITSGSGELAGAVQGLVQDFAESASIILSHDGTPAPSRIPTPAPVPMPTPISTEELFKQFIKIYKASVKVME